MNRLYHKLKEREEHEMPIRVALIGAGFMGKSLFVQLCGLGGFYPGLLISRREESVRDALKAAGVEEKAVLVSTPEQAEKALQEGKFGYSTDISLAAKVKSLDCVVDATGDPVAGATIAEASLLAGHHVVSLNVEMDICVGPYLKRLADERGVVYTGTAGDEPGSAMELYDFAKFLGFEVLAMGKGKNNPIDYEATPDAVADQARQSGLAPQMLCSFIDGTKTMGELCMMANATGFVPDVSGGHGPEAGPAELSQVFRLETEGGILHRYGIVEYVRGVAPGVFVIVTHEAPEICEELTFLKLGDGPNYALYRPYHLTSIETPVSIAKAVLDGEATITPRGYRPVAAVPAMAKRDLLPGEAFDGLGGTMVLGGLVTWEDFMSRGYVPISLLDGHVKVKQPVAKGAYLTWQDIKLEKITDLTRLYMEMIRQMSMTSRG